MRFSTNKTFIPKKRIERAADNVLVEYGRLTKRAVPVVVPVEMIVEQYLRRPLEFIENLSAEQREANVLGATIPETRVIQVDLSLDPDIHPEAEGRFRFTVAHEIGHCVLHPDELAQVRDGMQRFMHTPSGRSSKHPIEWQADYFASCLLMPEESVRRQWSLVARETEVEEAVVEMAQCFHVSEIAMRIRLEGLAVCPKRQILKLPDNSR